MPFAAVRPTRFPKPGRPSFSAPYLGIPLCVCECVRACVHVCALSRVCMCEPSVGPFFTGNSLVLFVCFATAG